MPSHWKWLSWEDTRFSSGDAVTQNLLEVFRSLHKSYSTLFIFSMSSLERGYSVFKRPNIMEACFLMWLIGCLLRPSFPQRGVPNNVSSRCSFVGTKDVTTLREKHSFRALHSVMLVLLKDKTCDFIVTLCMFYTVCKGAARLHCATVFGFLL